MKIYILRHGIAEDPSATVSDAERRLTKEGLKKMSEIAQGIAKIPLCQSPHIISSPYLRAKETAEIVANALNIDSIQFVDYLFPHSDIDDTLIALKDFAHLSELMLVGHNPHLSYLTALLIGASPNSIELKKGGLAIIDCPSGPYKGTGSLLSLHTPKTSRELGK